MKGIITRTRIFQTSNMDQVNKYGKLPPVLYLQLDNTSKQCKSKYVLGYLACLVQWGIFERVVLSFLPVGHTHEDIDQMFSRLAVRLRRTDCLDRQAFIECFKKAFKNEWGTEGTGGHVETAANISDWIAPYLADTKKMKTAHKKVKRKGISSFHQFLFTLHENKVS